MARIISIEDSPVLQRLLAITMRDTSVEIEADLNGSGGLEAARANPPDLIVLDLGLPDMSGWPVLERLRAEPAALETPVVVTMGDTRGEYRSPGGDARCRYSPEAIRRCCASL